MKIEPYLLNYLVGRDGSPIYFLFLYNCEFHSQMYNGRRIPVSQWNISWQTLIFQDKHEKPVPDVVWSPVPFAQLWLFRD